MPWPFVQHPNPDHADDADYFADEHAKSIADPKVQLSDPARQYLHGLAREGADVYCYASGGEQYGTWCVWDGHRRPARRIPVVTYDRALRGLLWAEASRAGEAVDESLVLPGDEELLVLASAGWNGTLVQWTLDQGPVILSPFETAVAGDDDEATAISHIGQPCTTRYVLQLARGGRLLAMISFSDAFTTYAWIDDIDFA